jgi:N-acetylmuramoyl-L-alanine amidase
VAPDRKQDPGERFPWRLLAVAGHGLWTDIVSEGGITLAEGDTGEEVSDLQTSLALIGYEQQATGRFDAATRARLLAFQRHWVQDRIDGVADALTRERLRWRARLKD